MVQVECLILHLMIIISNKLTKCNKSSIETYEVVVILKGIVKICNPSSVSINENISLFLEASSLEKRDKNYHNK